MIFDILACKFGSNIDSPFEEGRNYGSIHIICKHQIFRLLEINRFIFNIVYDQKDIRSHVCIHIGPLLWTDNEILDRYKYKIYYFDDLDLWKMDNFKEYKECLKKYDLIITPRIEQYFLFLSRGLKAAYLPYSISESLPKTSNDKLPYIFLDIYTDKEENSEMATRSHLIAQEFLDRRESNGFGSTKIYVPNGSEVEGSTEKINHLNYLEFIRFLSLSMGYFSSIPGSYEFTPLEAFWNGVPVVSMKGALQSHHNIGLGFMSAELDDEYKTAYSMLLNTSRDKVFLSANFASRKVFATNFLYSFLQNIA
jgi:hypothetical protein